MQFIMTIIIIHCIRDKYHRIYHVKAECGLIESLRTVTIYTHVHNKFMRRKKVLTVALRVHRLDSNVQHDGELRLTTIGGKCTTYHDENDVPHVVGADARRLTGERHGGVLVLLVAVGVRRHFGATLDVRVQVPLLFIVR